MTLAADPAAQDRLLSSDAKTERITDESYINGPITSPSTLKKSTVCVSESQQGRDWCNVRLTMAVAVDRSESE